jgi:hypothetical protein
VHDGRVDPEKHTIKRLRALFNRRKGGSVDLNVRITPDGPIFGPCDTRGFSAAKLKLGAGGEWSEFDARAPVRQMVPIGEQRTLRVKGTNDSAVTFVLDSQIARIVSQTNDTVTVVGSNEGQVDMDIRVEGQSQSTPVRLLVRRASSIAVDVVHLGAAPLANGFMIATQRSVVGTITQIYKHQANVTFTAGTQRIVDTVSGVRIDPNKPLRIRATIGPPAAEQEIRFDDLVPLIADSKAVTMFISAQLADPDNPNVAGRGSQDDRILWFNPMSPGSFNSNIVPAHEIGHALGLQHITTSNNSAFLMNPVVQANNIIIPCETLVQLNP